MPQEIIDLLNLGIEACQEDKYRQGNLVSLPGTAELVVTGDIHGHRRNFERVVSFADLANHPNRHIILQEIVHGGLEDATGCCLSYKLLFDVVRYKLQFPDRIHMIMGNHDTSVINNSNVMKDGKEMNQAMLAALDREFAQDSQQIILALRQFLFSQPLAVKCENRIWISHSLPNDRDVDKFDRTIFERKLKVSDVVRPNSAYLLTWGRNHSQETLDKLAEMFDVDVFILGHQPQSEGWGRLGENLLVLTSEHNHGCLLLLDLSKSYTLEELVKLIVPLASIA
jgi:predicted phosphodiesterase